MIWNKPGQEGERGPWPDKSKRSPRGGGKKGQPGWFSWMRRGGRFLRGPGSLSGLALALVLVWVAIGGYVSIDAGQVGVVSRLGRYQRTLDPGWHLKLPSPFEIVQKVDLERIHSLSDSVQVLTWDQNLLEAAFSIQYRITDPRRYLFVLADVNAVVAGLGQVAVKNVLAGSAKHDLEDTDSTTLTVSMREQLQKALDRYQAGLRVEAMGLSRLTPPVPVNDMTEEWSSIQEDNRAQAQAAHNYAAQHLPTVRAAAEQRVAAARASQTLHLQRAQAQVDRFDALLPAYRMAPAETRRLLWQETLTQVLAANTKIVADSGGHAAITVSVGGAPARASSVPLPAVSTTANPAPADSTEAQLRPALDAPAAKTDDLGIPAAERL